MDFAVRNRPSICNAYETFGECMNTNCRYSHGCWPYKSHKLYATISLDNAEISGIVRFIIKEKDEPSKPKQDEFYIPHHPWYNKRAVAGDNVELQVSEKLHRLSGCNIGRIVRIITPAHVSNDVGRRNRSSVGDDDCFEFSTFNDCTFGEKCKRVHRCEAMQVIELGKIVSIIPCHQNNGILLKLRKMRDLTEKTYVIPNGRWHKQSAKEGDVVIFQESSRQYDRDNGSVSYGKVLTVLASSTALDTTNGLMVERSLKHAFTIDPPGTRTRIGACSIEKCKRHGKDCKVIGIHVLAFALMDEYNKKPGKDFIPIYRQSVVVGNFSLDTIQLAISVYAHSESDCIEGPLISSVHVDARDAFTYGELDQYDKYLDLLWSRFARETFVQLSAKHWLSSFIVDYPDTWKERFVITRIRTFFNEQVTNFMKSRRGLLVLVQNLASEIKIAKCDLLIPMKLLNGVEGAWKSDKSKRDFQLAALFGSTYQAAGVFLEETYLPDTYRTEAIPCEEIPEDKIIKSTAPNKHTRELINQQVLVDCMIGRPKPMYTKEEIYGILVHRYDTPTIFKSVVRALYNTSVLLQFVGIRDQWRRNYQEVKLKHLLRPSMDEINGTLVRFSEEVAEDSMEENSDFFFPVESISIILKGLHTTEYCNTSLAKICGETISKLRSRVLEAGVESEAVNEALSELISSKTEEFAPYESHEFGTKITLKRGVELQLQISQNSGNTGEFYRNIRLLRIGKDCHLCTTHRNSPKRAFLSYRGDVREFVTQEMTDKMKNDIAKNMLATTTLHGIAIQWKNKYFYGGAFRTNYKISLRSFLCIRKEVFNKQNDLLFVWNCHGVVSKISEDVIDFLVCNLGQDETAEISGANNSPTGYVVEVITIENE